MDAAWKYEKCDRPIFSAFVLDFELPSYTPKIKKIVSTFRVASWLKIAPANEQAAI